MEANQKLTSWFSLVVMFATAILGWFSMNDSGVPRLGDNRLFSEVVADEQDVTARLWEDPLQAVQAEATRTAPTGKPDADGNKSENDPEKKHSLDSLSVSVAEKVKALSKGSACLLVVPIPDTPYPDDHETRLRLRYSVQMALADCSFQPANHSYLGFVRLTGEDNPGFSSKVGSVIPYEWFIPRRQQRAGGLPIKETAVLVLWLPESRLARQPLQFLNGLVCHLNIPSAVFSGIFVVGPQSSDTLKSIVQDIQEPASGATYEMLRDKLAILSPGATAPDGILRLKPNREWSQARQDLAEQLRRRITGTASDTSSSWSYFTNLIATDDQLTDLIVTELGLRRIDPAEDRILVLAEADTAYGRSLPIALQSSLDERQSLPSASYAKCAIETGTPERIAELMDPDHPASDAPSKSKLEIYRYLRGLDQQKGQASATDKPATRLTAKPIDESLAAALSRSAAMALGESQLDYVDRLVREIAGSVRKRNEVKAVGVLGGNIYDKLILLRALRPRFPDALFFTTDLDARLWHPDHLPYTRNVVVASATDVSGVAPGLNKTTRIPPFRDSYQKTVFNACRVALGRACETELFGGSSEAQLPLIFEIGRDGPVRLASFTPPSPAIPWPHPFARSGLGLVGALGGALLAIHLYKKNYQVPSAIGSHFAEFVAGAIALLLVSVFLARYVLPARFGGEPWSVTLGVSVWPTEIMRLAIGLMVIGAFWLSQCRQRKSREDLVDDFSLKDAIPADVKQGQKGPPHVAKEEYDRHVAQEAPRERIKRVLLATSAYLALGFGVMFWINGGMPPNTHVRGSLAQGLDIFFLFASVLCFLAFVFHVLDAVLLTERLLRKIKERTIWPAAKVQKTRERFAAVDYDNLDRYLDVSFAAQLSAETGRLIFLPFLIQFLFILSRNSYFDNWTWPGALLAIFIGNAVLAFVAWGILRHSANQIRREALRGLNESLRTPDPLPATWETVLRREHLREMSKDIEAESRGAYSRVFQDPAVLAVFLPSSIFGVLAILARTLFSGS